MTSQATSHSSLCPKTVKQYLLFLLFRSVRCLARSLPPRVMLVFFSSMGSLTRFICRREAQISLAQIHFAFVRFDLLQAKAQDIVRASFAHFGESLGELLLFDRLLEFTPAKADNQLFPQFLHITSTSQQLAKTLMDNKRTVVALSAHTGCFELLAAYYAKCGAQISVIGRNPNYSALSQILREFRKSYGVTTIWRDDTAAGVQFFRAIKAARVLAVLIDQDTNLENGFQPFFELDAAFPIGPIQLAVRHRFPIITTFIVRTKRLHHKIVTEEVPYDSGDPNAVQQVLATYSSRLERIILEYPDQWVWWHRRWRRRPGIDYEQDSHQLRSTANYLSWLEEKENEKRQQVLSDGF